MGHCCDFNQTKMQWLWRNAFISCTLTPTLWHARVNHSLLQTQTHVTAVYVSRFHAFVVHCFSCVVCRCQRGQQLSNLTFKYPDFPEMMKSLIRIWLGLAYTNPVAKPFLITSDIFHSTNFHVLQLIWLKWHPNGILLFIINWINAKSIIYVIHWATCLTGILE